MMQLKKLHIIAIKDLRLIFRDRSALVLMLLAPFILTIGMGALTGRFSGGGNSSFSDIPIQIVNKDEGALGQALVDLFQSEELDELIAASIVGDLDEARLKVDTDQSAAAIYIPPGFTESVMPSSRSNDEVVKIEFYSNPTQPTSAGVLSSILDQFLFQVEVGRVSAEVIVTQLLQNGIINPGQAVALGAQIGKEMGQNSSESSAIQVRTKQAEGEGLAFDILAYMAPGMALMFLMFTVTYGARSLLVENQNGTLQRLLVTPTKTMNVLGGKMVGIFFTAVAQMIILVGGTSLLFQLQWGDTMGVLVLILAASYAATGWGILFAAILKTPGQIAITGSAIMLLFGLLGGSFFDLSMLPDWIQVVNKITPNSWANNGFRILAFGGKLQNIHQQLIALVMMGSLLFIIATFRIRKRGLVRK